MHNIVSSGDLTAVRRPAALEGWTLVATTWLSTVAASLLSPVLPAMSAHFVGTRALDLKISLVATLPAFFIAALAAPAGFVGDRLGHRKMLLWAVCFYGFAGMAPLILASLTAIIATRAAVGITEAVIMTSANALLAACFAGAARRRWLALETATAPISAMVLLALGGMLGQFGWRTPFFVYGIAFAMVALVARLREPGVTKADGTESTKDGQEPEEAHSPADQLPAPFSPRLLAIICLITFLGATAFFITIIQFGFLSAMRGITSTAVIGLWAAVSSGANPVGAGVFALWRRSLPAKLGASLLLFSVGFAMIAWIPSFNFMVAGAAIANLGAGMFLPTMITWALASLPANKRGAGVGAWNTAFFLGQFASPLLVLWLTRSRGSLEGAIGVYSVTLAAGGLAALLCTRARLAGAAS